MITQKTILSYDTSKNLPNPEKPALSLQVQASEKETLHWSLLCRFQNFFLMPPPPAPFKHKATCMWGDSRGILGNHREQSDLRKGHQPGTDAGCLSVTLEGLHRRPRATFGQGEGDHRLAPKDSSPKTQVRSQVGAEPGRRRGRGGGARAGSAPVRPPLGGAGGGPASPRSRRPGRPARGFLPRRQAAAVAAGGFARRRSSRLAARGDPAAAERTPLRGCVRLGTAPAPAGGRYRCFFLGWALAKTLLRWGGSLRPGGLR